MPGKTLSSPRNIKLGATAAPVLIIGAMVLMNSVVEPQSSEAQIEAPPDPQAMLIASMGGLNDAQKAAMAFSETIAPLEESASPFPLNEAVEDEPDDDEYIPEMPGTETGPSLTVTAVMASRAGAIALINGKAHREGDEIGDGWTIRTIDAQAKLVVVQRGDGDPVSIGLHQQTAVPRR